MMRHFVLLLLWICTCSTLRVLSAPLQTTGNNSIDFVTSNMAISGINKVYLENNNGLISQKMFEDKDGNPLENTKFVIQYDYKLVEDIVIPSNCILLFDGGCIDGNHDLIGNNTFVEAGNEQIFGFNVTIKGTWTSTANVYWFGAKTSGKTSLDNVDVTTALQKAIDSPFYHIYFPVGWYYITKTLVISEEKWLDLEGIPTEFRARNVADVSCASIYINRDIDIIQIAIDNRNSSKQIRLTGGCLDASKLEEKYTKSALHVFCSKSIWRLDITTNMQAYAFNGNNNKGIYLDSDHGEDGSGITNVNIFDNVISGFYTGIRIDDYNRDRYVTNVVHSGLINNCVKAAYIGGSTHIFKGMYQPAYSYGSRYNGEAFFDVTAAKTCFDGVIWDVNVGEKNKFTSQFSVYLGDNCREIFFNGLSAENDVYNTLTGKLSAVIIGDSGSDKIQSTVNAIHPSFYTRDNNILLGSKLDIRQCPGDSYISLARLTIDNSNNSIFEHIIVSYASDVKGENIALFSLAICGTNNNYQVTLRELWGGGTINRTICVLSDNSVSGKTTLHLCAKRGSKIEGYTDFYKFVTDTKYNWDVVPKDVTADGYKELRKLYLYPLSGSTDVRNQIPALTDTDAGITFYDTTLRKHVYWDSKSDKWREEDGAVAGVARSGDFYKKPAGIDIYIGFQYFNTDTHKMITWDGAKWFNPDGTEAKE